jgi:HEAT repeat protein
VNAYIERQKLWSGTQDEVHAALGVGEPEIQLEAIRIIRERRFKSEAPTLLELLNHENERLRDAALGALVDFREQKAVAVLARQRSMRDRREMRKIIEAISVLGGEEARDYLGFVAETHDDAEIKEMAQKARERLNRRAENPAQR